jgi:hypothetical protein
MSASISKKRKKKLRHQRMSRQKAKKLGSRR